MKSEKWKVKGEMSESKLVITGSIAFDYLMSFPGKFSDHFLPDKLDRISVSFLVDSMKKQRGGIAANIAYNLALMGENPMVIGTVGQDFDLYCNALEKTGVDTSYIKKIDDEYTASFFVSTDQVGNQIASFYTGAMRFAKDISLKNLSVKEEKMVIISPNDPEAMVKYVRECQELNIPFIYDPSQQIVRLDSEVLKEGVRGAKMLILNDYELEMFKKKTGLVDKDLLNLTDIVVTSGEKGSIILTKEKKVEIPIVQPKKIVDPTGVGDAYRAGLIKGMVNGLSWEISGRLGALAAAYVLETDGPQNHVYNLNEFVEKYCQVFGESNDVRRLV